MPEDYYSLLGVDRDASEEAILRAYRERAAEHHPDVSDDPDAQATFRRLNRAKAVLTDDARRREYDRLGHDRFVARADHGDGAAGRREDRRVASDRPDDWSAGTGRGLEHLIDFLVGSGRFLPAWRSAGPRRRASPVAGREINLEQLLRSGGRQGGVAQAGVGGSDCPTCRGRGTFVHLLDTGRGKHRRVEPCERCGGSGTVR